MNEPHPPWRHPGYVAVLELVAARAGLRPPGCPPAAMEGIDQAMARAGLPGDFEAYLARLEAEPALLDDLLVELTIGETYFFRNPEHFDFVRQEVLKDLTRRRGPRHGVRAWSAGCASGEEPYSLAVLLMEEGYGDRMEVWGTDVSRAALARARAASYGEWSLRGPQAVRMDPFLRQEGKRYVLAPEVRERVQFDYLNLAEDTWPFGLQAMDLIFCRNVLIYFNRATIEGVARRLHAMLAEGGFLILGPSDPPLGKLAPFESLLTDCGIVYRRPAAGPTASPALDRAIMPPPLPAAPSMRAPSPAPPPPLAPEGLEEARRALARGDWREAASRAGALQDDPGAAAVAVRALSNLDPRAAARACAEATTRHPLAVELRYLEAVLLLGLGHPRESERAVRQALYLEPDLAVAHLMLGRLLRHQGDTTGALRSFRTAESLCATRPEDEPAPLAEGERAGRLREMARAERTRLESPEEEAH